MICSGDHQRVMRLQVLIPQLLRKSREAPSRTEERLDLDAAAGPDRHRLRLRQTGRESGRAR